MGFAVNAMSSSASGVSNRLPNASGWFPAANFTEAGPGVENVPTTGSTSASGNAVVTAASLALATGPKTSFATRPVLTGAGAFSTAAGSFPNGTPARAKADFTIEISGSGATNGFFNTPSTPTLRHS